MMSAKKSGYGRSKWANQNQVGTRLSDSEYAFLKSLQTNYGLSQSDALKMCIREAEANYNPNKKVNTEDGKNKAE